MNINQYNSIKEIPDRIDALTDELVFLIRPETLRYSITELSRREPWFDYNDYGEEIVELLSGSMHTELIELQTKFDDIYVSGSL